MAFQRLCSHPEVDHRLKPPRSARRCHRDTTKTGNVHHRVLGLVGTRYAQLTRGVVDDREQDALTTRTTASPRSECGCGHTSGCECRGHATQERHLAAGERALLPGGGEISATAGSPNRGGGDKKTELQRSATGRGPETLTCCIAAMLGWSRDVPSGCEGGAGRPLIGRSNKPADHSLPPSNAPWCVSHRQQTYVHPHKPHGMPKFGGPISGLQGCRHRSVSLELVFPSAISPLISHIVSFPFVLVSLIPPSCLSLFVWACVSLGCFPAALSVMEVSMVILFDGTVELGGPREDDHLFLLFPRICSSRFAARPS